MTNFFCLLCVFLVMLVAGADLGGGCRGCAPPTPWDDLRFSNTTGILPKKKKLCGLLVLKYSKRWVHPLLKKILDPPLSCHLDCHRKYFFHYFVFSLFHYFDVKTIFITTFTGSGKSCLLGNWSLHHKEKFPKDAVVDHFAGCTSGSTGGKTFHSPLAHLP